MHKHPHFGRMLALLLAVVMVFSALSVSAFAANRENVKQYGTYMCIGDSIAAGYTLSGERDNFFRVRVPGAYHDIVADATGAKLNQFGWSAFRSVELRYLLEGVRNDPDGVWLENFQPLVNNDLLDRNRADYLNAIRESDLISVNLGSNDVMSYAMTKTMSLLTRSNDCELAAMATECLEKCGDFGTAFVKLMSLAEKAGKLPLVLASLNPTLMKALAYFKNNFNACLKGIYALNPDATVVVVGVFNPMANLRLIDNGNLKLGAILQPTVDLLNAFLKSGSNYASRYLFAPVPNTTTYDMSLTGMLKGGTDNMRTRILWDVHPTHVGHSYMADQILSVLPTADGRQGGFHPFAWLRGLWH